MAATRKLQGEIDRCLKKVAEGVEQFEDIWKKVQNANNTNQKEKYEADLKKEIKKLQRLRDQIKSWLTSGEIKDKTVLLANRKIIETQMERFKVVERETKTKAYSKEGLGASQNRDPAMKERDEQSRWISDRIENLTIQGETIECEIETLHVVGKKKKVDKEKMERIDEKKDWLEKHRFHIKKLEILLRMLNNESIEVNQVKRIKDDIDYYVECNQFPDFIENECIYDDINMDELDMATVGKPAVDGTEGSTPTPSIGSSPSPASSSVSALPVSNNSTPAAESSKASTVNHSSSNVESLSLSGIVSDLSTTAVSSVTSNHTAIIAPLPATTTPVTSTSTTNSTSNSTVQNNHHNMERQSKRSNKEDSRTPVKPTAVRANVNATNNKGTTPNKATTNNTSAMSYLAASQHNTKNSAKKDVSDHNSSHITSIASSNVSNVTNHVHVNSTQTIQQQLLLQQQHSQQQQHTNAVLNTTDGVTTNASMKPTAQKKLTDVMTQQNQGNAVIASVPTSTRSSTVSTSSANNSNVISVSLPPPTTPVVTSGSNQQQPATGEAHIPPLLGAAPLGTTPLTSEHDIQYKRLQAAYCHMPHPADSERIRSHLPRQSVVTPLHFPQTPPPQSDSVEFFNRLSTETLFFIFYYLEGTKAQYLAAKALKKQSWRFHTKYMMWFQRHEEPKAITDEYEQGTYIFFDYDNWGQRKKENFTFEYRFLEDRDLN